MQFVDQVVDVRARAVADAAVELRRCAGVPTGGELLNRAHIEVSVR